MREREMTKGRRFQISTGRIRTKWPKLLVAVALSLFVLSVGILFTRKAITRRDSDPEVRSATLRKVEPREKRSFSTEANPDVRWWWGGVPDEVRLAALKTDDLSNIRPDDYVGTQKCSKCHEKNHKNWLEHRHRWMNAPATGATVVGDFGGQATIEYYGGLATFYREDSSYRMQLVRDQLRRTYRVTQTLGSRFYQYYIGVQVKGPEPQSHALYEREHVLPFGYWIDQRQWLPVVHVGGGLREGEPSVADRYRSDPFAEPLMIGYAEKCSRCHTTQPIGDWLVGQIESIRHSPRGFDFNMLGYLEKAHPDLLSVQKNVPSMSTPEIEKLIRIFRKKKARVWDVTSGIMCEACHNGCRSHVENADDVMPRFFPVNPDIHIVGQDIDEVIGLTAANQNWVCARCHSGSRFEFAAGMASWNSVEYDDAIKGGCYKPVPGKNHLTCVHCHEPHTTIGRRWKRSPDEDDASCLSCHEQYEDPDSRRAHTHHQSTSAGSRCMNCHMPRINEGLQDMVRTHMILNPTNADMIESNQPNACNMCHVEKSIDWTIQYLHQWYGRSYSKQRMAENYDQRNRSDAATIGWLNSWHPPTQMVAADVLTKHGARWALPKLLPVLDSPYMLNRQFATQGLKKMLGIHFADFGYRFTMFADERRQPLAKIWTRLVGDDSDFPYVKDAQDEAEETIRHYRRVVAYDPDSYTARHQLAVALLASGKADDGVEHLRKTLEINPNSYAAHHELAVVHLKKGESRQAIHHFQRSLKINPEFADSHYALGMTYQSQGDMNAAVRQFREGLHHTPNHAGLHNVLGAVLAQRGALDQAIHHLEQAVRINPDFEKARLNLATLRRMKQNRKQGKSPSINIQIKSKDADD